MMIGNAFKSKLTGAPGWETEAEQDLLAEFAGKVPEGCYIVEIGAEFGMSTSIFAKYAQGNVQVTSVDLFPTRPEYGSMLNVLRANLQECGLTNKTHQLAMSSVEAAGAWEVPITLLFIDGDHTYEGVKADIGAWLHFIPVGGRVIFHDCACQTNKLPHYLHFEVTKAVSEWFQANGMQWQLVKMVDTCMVFERTALDPAAPEPQADLNLDEELIHEAPAEPEVPAGLPARKPPVKPVYTGKKKRSRDED